MTDIAQETNARLWEATDGIEWNKERFCVEMTHDWLKEWKSALQKTWEEDADYVDSVMEDLQLCGIPITVVDALGCAMLVRIV